MIERITREDQDSEEENEVEQEPDKELSFNVEYGITSLVDKKTVLQHGDKVHCFPHLPAPSQISDAIQKPSSRQTKNASLLHRHNYLTTRI